MCRVHEQKIEMGNSSPPSDRGQLGSWGFDSVVLLLLGTQDWFLAPTSDDSELLAKSCPGCLIHSSVFCGHQVPLSLEWWKVALEQKQEVSCKFRNWQTSGKAAETFSIDGSLNVLGRIPSPDSPQLSDLFGLHVLGHNPGRRLLLYWRSCQY